MSVSLTIILGLIILLVIFITCTYELAKRDKERLREIEALENTIQEKNHSLAYITKHIEELASIQRSESELKHRIEDAKTDEEIGNIIDLIVNANNERVQEYSAAEG